MRETIKNNWLGKKMCWQIETIDNKAISLSYTPISMPKKAINRLKVVLVEHGRTNKWLAEKLGMNESTISRWCTNEKQPTLDKLIEVAKTINVDVRELIYSTQTK